MGRHSAERIPVRDLRSAYNRLREAYERLLGDHLALKGEYLGLLDSASGGPSSYGAELELWRPPSHLLPGVPMGVDEAHRLVRSSGLLTSPGLEA